MALAWTLLARPNGMPRATDFALKFLTLPALEDGMVHVRNRFLSVDPYMRGRMNDAKSYAQPYALNAPMAGGAIGEIVASRAEGFAAGELKHGPIALIDEAMPVVVIAPYDRVFEKTVSNMQEVAARGGRLILVTDAKGAAAAERQALATLTLPTVPSVVGPLIYAVPVQLIAYHTAVALGTDVDQPRNLATSVTVD